VVSNEEGMLTGNACGRLVGWYFTVRLQWSLSGWGGGLDDWMERKMWRRVRLFIYYCFVRRDSSFCPNNCKPLSQSGIFRSKQACFAALWVRKAAALTRQRTRRHGYDEVFRRNASRKDITMHAYAHILTRHEFGNR
jgi:hypothetical protein